MSALAKNAPEAFEVDALEFKDFRSEDYLRDPERQRADFEIRVQNILEEIDGRANLTLSLGVGLAFQNIVLRATQPSPAAP